MGLHSGKLTWQWKTDPLKTYFLLKIGIFHCYVSLPEGRWSCQNPVFFWNQRMNSAQIFIATVVCDIWEIVIQNFSLMTQWRHKEVMRKGQFSFCFCWALTRLIWKLKSVDLPLHCFRVGAHRVPMQSNAERIFDNKTLKDFECD